MTDNLPELLVKLRYMGKQYAAGQYARGGGVKKHYLEEAADLLESERARADALKTVMIAAAEEIAAHWEAHCDTEGYGPQNLLHRLEEGIPSEYGYTAGAFADLKSRADALEAALRLWQGLYRRAINQANGLTNYVEDRPELRHAEKELAAIETAARSLLEKTPLTSKE